MSKVVLGLWIAALLFAGYWFGYYQEGANSSIALEMDGRIAISAPISMEYAVKNISMTKRKLAVKGSMRTRSASSELRLIIDMSKKEMYGVLDDRKVYTKVSFELADKSECEKAEAVSVAFGGSNRQPDSKTILGYRCHKFGSGKGGLGAAGEAWYTYEIRLGRDLVSMVNKLMRMEMEEGMAPGMAAGGKKHKQVSSFEYFPVPLLMNAQMGGLLRMKLEVKSIERGKIDQSIFEIPSGYEEMDPEKFTQEVSGQFQGGRSY